MWTTENQRRLAKLALRYCGRYSRVPLDSLLKKAKREGIYKDTGAAGDFLKKLVGYDDFPFESSFHEDGHMVFYRTDVEVNGDEV